MQTTDAPQPDASGKRRMRLIGIVILNLVAFGALGAYILTGGLTRQVQPAVTLGGPFELVTTGGQPITEAYFAGKPYAVFFGFTHCPDVCPTTLSEMAHWIGELGADADRMRFAFVTVDPARDTHEILSEYVGYFSDRIVPMTGSEEAVRNAISAFRIYAQRVDLEGGDYTMDHSASVYLMDADNNFVRSIGYGEGPERALSSLRSLIGR